MMDFFDSPLFWIVVIWWLLSTFLGAKARKRRAARMLLEPEAETPIAPEAESIQFGIDNEKEEEAAQPVGIEFREEVPELDMQPVSSSAEFPTRVKPAASPEPPARKPPLEQFVRSLGIPKEFIPSGILPTETESLPERETEKAEQEIQPEEEMMGLSAVHPAPETSYDQAQVTFETADGISRLQTSVLLSLTPLQQAIVLKEILDRPRALRRSIR